MQVFERVLSPRLVKMWVVKWKEERRERELALLERRELLEKKLERNREKKCE